LCGLVALGRTAAEAAGIGVHLRGHAQNIPRAVAGDITRMSAWRAGAVATKPEHTKYSA
jgi:hypothetical protein